MTEMMKGCLLTIIVDAGKAKKIMDCFLKELHAKGGTYMYGNGTVQQKMLKLLNLDGTKKEILFIVMKYSEVDAYFKMLQERFHFNQAGKGIAFTVNLASACGLNTNLEEEKLVDSKRTDTNDDRRYKTIFVIVNRGDGDVVVDAAQAAGAKGATVMHGRGTGDHVKHRLFDLVIEPEKELVLLLVEEDKADSIIAAVDAQIHFDAPGAGILFSLPTDRVIGLA